MTPALIVSNLQDALKPLIAAEKGTLTVSDTPDDTLSLLAKSPQGFRCIIQWAGHQGDDDTHGSSKTGEVAVIVQVAGGLQADRGHDAHRSRPGNTRPILELVPLINNWIRSIVFKDEDGILLEDIHPRKSKGRTQIFSEDSGDWLEIDGVHVRQYRTTFSLRYADRQIDDEARSVVVAINTPIAEFTRAEFAGDGARLVFTTQQIRRVYMAYLNGQAVDTEDVALDEAAATFVVPPQPGDTVMLLGAS